MTDWVENRAEAVLSSVPEYVWDGESLPVPVDDIVDSCYGLHVMEVDDMTSAPGCPPLDEGQSLSGLLLVDEKQIWCNADEARQWPGRKRFTIAHELGHWVLHKPGQHSLFCRRAVVVADEAARERERAGRPPLPATRRRPTCSPRRSACRRASSSTTTATRRATSRSSARCSARAGRDGPAAARGDLKSRSECPFCERLESGPLV